MQAVTCRRVGCERRALFRVGFEIDALHMDTKRVRHLVIWLVAFYVCDEHRLDARSGDIMTPEGERSVYRLVLSRCRSLVQFSTMQMLFDPLIEKTQGSIQ